MRFKNLPFALALTLVAALIVGCGDDNKGTMTKEEVAYWRQRRMQEMYGGGSSSTTTSTQTVTVITAVTVSTTVGAH